MSTSSEEVVSPAGQRRKRRILSPAHRGSIRATQLQLTGEERERVEQETANLIWKRWALIEAISERSDLYPVYQTKDTVSRYSKRGQVGMLLKGVTEQETVEKIDLRELATRLREYEPRLLDRTVDELASLLDIELNRAQ
jgi:hypothetical protein